MAKKKAAKKASKKQTKATKKGPKKAVKKSPKRAAKRPSRKKAAAALELPRILPFHQCGAGNPDKLVFLLEGTAAAIERIEFTRFGKDATADAVVTWNQNTWHEAPIMVVAIGPNSTTCRKVRVSFSEGSPVGGSPCDAPEGGEGVGEIAVTIAGLETPVRGTVGYGSAP